MLKHIFIVNCMGNSETDEKNFVGQNCRNFDLVPKILSAEKFCPPKFCPIRYINTGCFKTVE